MKKQITAFAMAIVLAATLVPATAFAAATQSDQQDTTTSTTLSMQAQSSKLKKKTKTMRARYKAILKRAIDGTGAFKGIRSKANIINGRSTYYADWYSIFDIDKNGTPELIVNVSPGYDAGARCFVYTIKSGKAKKLGTFGDGQTILGRKSKALYGVRQHMGATTVTRVKLKSGVLKTNKSSVAISGLTWLDRCSPSDTSAINKAKVI